MLSFARLFLSFALLFPSCSLAAPTGTGNPGVSALGVVDATPNLENIAVRSNGDLLVTSVFSATIHQVFHDGTTSSVPVATIPGRNATLGIAELEKDVFYVVACDYIGMGCLNNEIWQLDMRAFSSYDRANTTAQFSLAAIVPEAQILNGLTRLAKNDSANLLASDSAAGTVTRINILTGEVTIVQQDNTMAILPSGLGVGINGVHTFGSTLYYTSLDQGLFVSVPISLVDGSATGPVNIIINGTLQAADDFTLSRDGRRAWITENGINVVKEVDIARKTSTVAVNSTTLGASSSIARGRTCSNWNTLYVAGARTLNGTSNGQVTKVEGLV